MRTTIDLPDGLFLKMKATAAARGVSMRELVVAAVDRDIAAATITGKQKKRRPKLPQIHLEKGRVPDLSNFDFDNLT